jgi:mRNA interferase RelE/StbE
MAKYKIEIKKSAAKEIKNLPSSYLNKIIDRISKLADNPRAEGCIKLSSEELYRIRVGTYRIIYQIKDDRLIVIVIKVAHRKSVYR